MFALLKAGSFVFNAFNNSAVLICAYFQGDFIFAVRMIRILQIFTSKPS